MKKFTYLGDSNNLPAGALVELMMNMVECKPLKFMRNCEFYEWAKIRSIRSKKVAGTMFNFKESFITVDGNEYVYFMAVQKSPQKPMYFHVWG